MCRGHHRLLERRPHSVQVHVQYRSELRLRSAHVVFAQQFSRQSDLRMEGFELVGLARRGRPGRPGSVRYAFC